MKPSAPSLEPARKDFQRISKSWECMEISNSSAARDHPQRQLPNCLPTLEAKGNLSQIKPEMQPLPIRRTLPPQEMGGPPRRWHPGRDSRVAALRFMTGSKGLCKKRGGHTK